MKLSGLPGDVEAMEANPKSVREWFVYSKEKSADFFSHLDGWTDNWIKAMLQRELDFPPNASLRGPKEVNSYSRKPLRPLSMVANGKPDEKNFQSIFLHRGYLEASSEEIVFYEYPIGHKKDTRKGSVDLVVFDRESKRPIIVELKQARANDPLIGVVLEITSYWLELARHQSQFEAIIREWSNEPDGRIEAIELAICAPHSFYGEMQRKSRDPIRCNEIDVGLRFIKLLEEEFGVPVRLLAVADNWQSAGTGFSMCEWRGTANNSEA